MSRTRKAKNQNDNNIIFDEPRRARKAPPLTPLNKSQEKYMNLIETKDMIFSLGSAGTGKSYVATSWAADALKDRKFKKLIVTRPVVEAGESLGFLPGEIEEKVAPYFMPILEILNERLGSSYVESLIKNNSIEFIPLAYLRGRSFADSIVLLDEAQNVTPTQMKMFLSRFGEGSKFIIDGDYRQTDIEGDNGLLDAEKKLKSLPEIGFITFTRDDIVRSGLCRKIIDKYET